MLYTFTVLGKKIKATENFVVLKTDHIWFLNSSRNKSFINIYEIIMLCNRMFINHNCDPCIDIRLTEIFLTP